MKKIVSILIVLIMVIGFLDYMQVNLLPHRRVLLILIWTH